MSRPRAELRSWQPREIIDVAHEQDLRYWTDRLGVTPEQLIEAVEEVGDCAAAVATEFGVALTAPP